MTEVPDADKAEQNTPFDPDDEASDQDMPSLPFDAPEADVVEQSIPVPIDDDYR